MSKLKGNASRVLQTKILKENEMAEEKEAPKRVSRRQFVKGAAVGGAGVAAAGVLASCAPAATPAPAPTCPPAEECAPCAVPGVPETWDKEADVVVVGFGGAGGCAALEASDAGSQVLILERTATPGGSSTICGGYIAGSGTSVQEAAGVAGTAEEYAKYWMECAEGLSDPELVRTITEKSAETIEWLIGMGSVFSLVYSGNELKYAATNPPIMHGHISEPIDPPFDWPPELAQPNSLGAMEGGTGLFVPLYEGVNERGIEVALETRALELVANGTTGEVLGVKAESNGETLYIRAKRGVVLTTGNFMANKEMVKQYCPKIVELPIVGVATDDGDGIKMAQALGADLVNMNEACLVLLVSPGGPRAIWVNKAGQRFIGEDNTYEWLGEALVKQPDGVAFAIFDEATRTATETDVTTYQQASTIKELAAKIGIDPTTLDGTVNLYNAYVEAGKDQVPFPKFEENLVAMTTPPFYALQVPPPGSIATGGVKINAKGQVIDVFGEVIPRLYAAGRTTGGAIGFYYLCSGSAISEAFNIGRIAGQNVAAEEPWE